MPSPLPVSPKLRWMLAPPPRVAVQWLLRESRSFWPSNWMSSTGLLMRSVLGDLLGRLAPPPPTETLPPPVFIVGFWRTGTTLLHELLALDPRTGFLDCYQCMAPAHAHWTRTRALPLCETRFVSRRPMDDVPIRLEAPLEDEFYFLNEGVPSFYELFLFPEEGCRHLKTLDPGQWPKEVREAWLASLRRLLWAAVSPGAERVVAKSPAHGYRIPLLADQFPKASFIYLHRNPIDVFLSARHAFQANADVFSLHRASQLEALDGLIAECYQRHLRCASEARAGLGSRWMDVEYSGLVGEPLATLESLYRHFQWGGFETLMPLAQVYLEARADFQPHRFHPQPGEAGRLSALLGLPPSAP